MRAPDMWRCGHCPHMSYDLYLGKHCIFILKKGKSRGICVEDCAKLRMQAKGPAGDTFIDELEWRMEERRKKRREQNAESKRRSAARHKSNI